MPYIPHTERDISSILEAVGAGSVEDLLAPIPEELRLKTPLDLPEGVSEQELKAVMKGLAERNTSTREVASFLGAGFYNHYIPSSVDALAGRSEFFTAYTPYQPEVSQGTLQAVFEYQTMVCQLTGLDVSNASLYDGASAAAEAVLMARRVTRKDRVVLSSALHPEYRQAVYTYTRNTPGEVVETPWCAEKGTTLIEAAEKALDDDTACLVVQYPNFFGCVENVAELASLARSKGALLVTVTTEPVSLGLLKPPGELGADIAVGEMQSFGNPMNYGGPGAGFMATRQKLVRRMPGRIVGETVDQDGKRAFCLTFATREQHIRREKATSNICTNQGLCALRAAIHLTLLGKTGLVELARLNLSKAEYLKERLTKVDGVEAAFTAPTFNEFTVKFSKDPERVITALREEGIIGGLALKGHYPGLKDHVLVTATEMNARAEMDSFAAALEEA